MSPPLVTRSDFRILGWGSPVFIRKIFSKISGPMSAEYRRSALLTRRWCIFSARQDADAALASAPRNARWGSESWSPPFTGLNFWIAPTAWAAMPSCSWRNSYYRKALRALPGAHLLNHKSCSMREFILPTLLSMAAFGATPSGRLSCPRRLVMPHSRRPASIHSGPWGVS